MQFTLRTLLLLVLATAALFAIEITIEAKIGLLLSACLVAAVTHLVRQRRSLGAVIVVLYSVVGLLLLGAWCVGVWYFEIAPPG